MNTDALIIDAATPAMELLAESPHTATARNGLRLRKYSTSTDEGPGRDRE
jgi:hypothetical protein